MTAKPIEQPLPRRIAWFAPWKWKRRTKITAVLLLVLVAYPLGYGVSRNLWLRVGWLPYKVHATFYRPLLWLAEQNNAIGDWVFRYLQLFD